MPHEAPAFVGNSLKCLREFPEDARQDAGYQLDKVQRGEQPTDFKPMPTIGKGVEELRVPDESGSYRVIYAARLSDAVYVLHAFPVRRTDEGREMKKPKVETYASVWDAIADTPEEAANLRVRSDLMREITAIISESGWTQVEAAKHCGVTQPRINDLLRGRISRFSVDALVNIATALGRRVRVELEAA